MDSSDTLFLKIETYFTARTCTFQSLKSEEQTTQVDSFDVLFFFFFQMNPDFFDLGANKRPL